MKSEITGAGFVIFFDNRGNLVKEKEKEILYLTLTDFKGKYDFPKGAVDPFEKSFDCAIRETYEETKLKHGKNFQIYENQRQNFSKGLVMYLASYNLDFKDIHDVIDLRKHVQLLPNFKTGVVEHTDFDWLTYEQAIVKLPNFLKNVLDWAKLNIN